MLIREYFNQQLIGTVLLLDGMHYMSLWWTTGILFNISTIHVGGYIREALAPPPPPPPLRIQVGGHHTPLSFGHWMVILKLLAGLSEDLSSVAHTFVIPVCIALNLFFKVQCPHKDETLPIPGIIAL